MERDYKDLVYSEAIEILEDLAEGDILSEKHVAAIQLVVVVSIKDKEFIVKKFFRKGKYDNN